MPRFLIDETADAILHTLADALDLVDFGVVLLTPELRARFINRRCVEIWRVPSELLQSGPSFRVLLEHAARGGLYPVSEQDLPGYLDEREGVVRAGSVAPTQIDLNDGRRMLFRCIACPDGGRILTYADISQEVRRAAHDVEERIGAELRFSNETLENQAAHLATLAEAADEHAYRAETARLLLEREVAERRALESKLRVLATTDSLTGSLNRAAFLDAGQSRLMEAREQHGDLALLMIDVDHFKAVNDRFGHAGGDATLRHLVSTLRAGIRENDLLGRLGGEEFAVILSGANAHTATRIAERLRIATHDDRIEHAGRLISITISIGLAISQPTDTSIEQLLGRADTALYRAKREGRNRLSREEAIVAA